MTPRGLLPEIVFYQVPISHFCEKIRWALDYKRLEYRAVCVNPRTRKELAEIGGNRQVPVIRDGNRVVSDSSEIVEYLDEICPHPPLVPPKEPERADCLEIERIADEEVAPAVRRLAYGEILADREALGRLLLPKKGLIRLLNPVRRRFVAFTLKSHFGITRERLRADRLGLGDVLKELQERLGGRAYFVGDTLTIADIAVASLVGPLEIVEEFAGAPEFAGLFSWMRRIRSEHGRREWKK
jgi:glutathione S-transferase